MSKTLFESNHLSSIAECCVNVVIIPVLRFQKNSSILSIVRLSSSDRSIAVAIDTDPFPVHKIMFSVLNSNVATRQSIQVHTHVVMLLLIFSIA